MEMNGQQAAAERRPSPRSAVAALFDGAEGEQPTIGSPPEGPPQATSLGRARLEGSFVANSGTVAPSPAEEAGEAEADELGEIERLLGVGLDAPEDDQGLAALQYADERIANAEAQTMGDYTGALQEAVDQQQIRVGLMSVDELQERQQAIADAKQRRQAKEEAAVARRQAFIKAREGEARDRVLRVQEAKRQRLGKREELVSALRQEERQHLRTEYRRAQAKLRRRLERQQAVVQEKFGELTPLLPDEPLTESGKGLGHQLAKEELAKHERRPGAAAASGTAGASQRSLDTEASVRHVGNSRLRSVLAARRRIRVEWDRMPQPIAIRVRLLRAVKDKLPRGRYVLLATFYDQLGGTPQYWSEVGVGRGIGGPEWPGVTRAVRHDGEFFNTELDFGPQTIYAVVPPDRRLKPSNVIVFELFRLRSNLRTNPVDKVAGWAALPACNGDLRCVEGKFRLPVLHDPIPKSIDQYSKIEQTISKDLDRWLGNLYVEVRLLPREQLATDRSGIVGEFDSRLEYTRRLLGVEARRTLKREAPAKEAAPPSGGGAQGVPVTPTAAAAAGSVGSPTVSPAAAAHRDASLGASAGSSRRTVDSRAHSQGDGQRLQRLIAAGGVKSDRHVQLLAQDRHRGAGALAKAHGGGSGAGPVVLSHSARLPFGHDKTAGGVNEEHDSDWETDEEAEDTAAGGVKTVSTAVDRDRVLARDRRARRAADPEQAALGQPDEPGGTQNEPLDTFHYAVSWQLATGVGRGRPLSETQRKLRYLWDELTHDIAIPKLATVDGWIAMFVLFMAIYLRTYLHYLGQWLYLSALRIPIYEFSPTGYSVALKYVGNVLPIEWEIGMVFLGSCFVLVCFWVMMLVAWVSQVAVGTFPRLLSRFVAYFGIATILDPILILIVDSIAGNYDCLNRYPECERDLSSSACRCYEGDAYRLYYRFLQDEGSGIVGGLLTALINGAIIFVAILFLYLYLLRVHNDGRMLDIYRRLHAPESAFLLPDDFEVSQHDLLRAVAVEREQAERMKDRRVGVGVCTYTTTDPLADSNYEQRNTHVIVYTVKGEGRRQLHRHFLRTHDGTIVELFGERNRRFFKQGLEMVLQEEEEEAEEEARRFFAALDTA